MATPCNVKPSNTGSGGNRVLRSLDELSAEADVSRRFLEMEINRGRLRVIRMSARIVRVRQSDWEAYLAASETNGGAK